MDVLVPLMESTPTVVVFLDSSPPILQQKDLFVFAAKDFPFKLTQIIKQLVVQLMLWFQLLQAFANVLKIWLNIKGETHYLCNALPIRTVQALWLRLWRAYWTQLSVSATMDLLQTTARLQLTWRVFAKRVMDWANKLQVIITLTAVH